MQISFKFMKEEDIDLWNYWIEKQNTWLIESYDYINQKIEGNGYDYPYIILIDEKPIGYIQCTDLFAYKNKCLNPKGVFINEEPGTFGLDLFIAEEDYLDKGYGTLIVTRFVDKIFKEYNANTILVDPAFSNKRAIRCYEKAGFKFVRVENEAYIMKVENLEV